MKGPEFKRLPLCAWLIAALASAPAWSQTTEAFAFEDNSAFEMPLQPPLDAPLGGLHSRWDGLTLALASPGMNFITAETGSSRVVKGAPYRAEASSESTQVLMDGNRIVRRSVQRLARDAEGRTRVERLRSDGSVESVLINDVVAGKRYWLLPEKKRVLELGAGHAVRMHDLAALAPPAPRQPATPTPPAAAPAPPAPPTPPAAMSSDEARSWAEEMRRWAREFNRRLRNDRDPTENVESRVIQDANGGTRVVIKQTQTGPGGDLNDRPMDVDVVRVIESAGDVPDGAIAAIAGLTPLPIEAGPRGQGVTTALGSKEFDRVRADGTRTTWTIPAGKIGNEKPIEVISERWYSPELLLVVSSRHVDPRRGETSYRLNGLKRGDPDAALFQVPADYEKRPRARREDRGGN